MMKREIFGYTKEIDNVIIKENTEERVKVEIKI